MIDSGAIPRASGFTSLKSSSNGHGTLIGRDHRDLNPPNISPDGRSPVQDREAIESQSRGPGSTRWDSDLLQQNLHILKWHKSDIEIPNGPSTME